MTHELVVTNGRIVTPEYGEFDADVAADGDTISAIAAPSSLEGEGNTEIDADGKYVLPGAIDPHTHHGIYRGLDTDGETESRADLVGGVTTIGNFFRRAGAYEEILDDYFSQAESNYYHDYFFSLGLLSFDHVEEIPYVVDELGITSFKWYMNYKYAAREKFGVDCDMLDDFGDAFVRTLAEQDVPTTLGYHSENVEITNALQGGNPYLDSDSGEDGNGDGRDPENKGHEDGGPENKGHEDGGPEERGYEDFVEGFPGYAEAQSMVAGAALAKQHDYDDDFYAVHISSGRTADELAAIRQAGYDLWGETCIHYLTTTASEAGPEFKVNPPVRSKQDQETLWNRIADGTIQTIGTDHCANLSENKFGETFDDSLLGFPGTPVMLPMVLSEGVHEGRISLERAVEITATNTAKAWKLYPKKGTVRVGADADLAVVDLDETKTVTPDLLQGGPDYSPYDGREVTGWPTQTIVRGTLAYDDGDVVGEKGYGTHIDRPVEISSGET